MIKIFSFSRSIPVLLIFLISQSLVPIQSTSNADPGNSIYSGQIISKFTNISGLTTPPAVSIYPMDTIYNNKDKAYNLSVVIFKDKKIMNNYCLQGSIYDKISKAQNVSLAIFLNKKIKEDIGGSGGSGESVLGNGESDDSMNGAQVDDPKKKYTEKTMQAFQERSGMMLNQLSGRN